MAGASTRWAETRAPAEMMGIHVNRTKIIVFTISGLMAGAAVSFSAAV